MSMKTRRSSCFQLNTHSAKTTNRHLKNITYFGHVFEWGEILPSTINPEKQNGELS